MYWKPDFTDNLTYKYIVEKYNINVGKQYLVDIEEMKGSADLARLFADLKFKLGVEVGVAKGHYSEFLMQTIPGLKLYGIDPWARGAFEDGNPYKASRKYFDDEYEVAKKRLAPFGDNYKIIRKYSMEAVKDFEDGSLDFVYIDANHDFVNFAKDMHHWIKKVKPGGIISGHDYCYFPFGKLNHVKRCLIAYARAYRLIPLFATKEDRIELKRDRYRSWFYVRPMKEWDGGIK